MYEKILIALYAQNKRENKQIIIQDWVMLYD